MVKDNENFLSVACLILAGGKSSRMGMDKALICWDGVPLIQRTCQVAGECCDRVYILSPWPDRYRNLLQNECNFLLESEGDRGPLVGLASGLAKINADWLLLLACDMPLLESAVIQVWIKEISNIPEDVLAFVSKRDDRWEPLCGFYRREALPQLQQFIQQGGRSFQTWLERLSVKVISVGEGEAKMLFNCNTPADLENLNQLNDD